MSNRKNLTPAEVDQLLAATHHDTHYLKKRKALYAWLNIRDKYEGSDSEWLLLSEKGSRLSR
ncbi:tyrosine recombinase [Yersinia enterocolitica]|uniref:hypothetical protein n=1 Tax=Yersinia enterocolitica TaxID=630 RepID=UPI0005DC4C47|nr:hypothetical protein [Yersinia enterocolitica]CNL23938.1 tyrosine recombinase [Yersinia enterocolitica]